jgi:hypothetical protein
MSAVTTLDQDRKRLANLKARLALVGCELYETTDDSGRPLYVAVKWAATKHLQTMDALATWTAMVDGRAEANG